MTGFNCQTPRDNHREYCSSCKEKLVLEHRLFPLLRYRMEKMQGAQA